MYISSERVILFYSKKNKGTLNINLLQSEISVRMYKKIWLTKIIIQFKQKCLIIAHFVIWKICFTVIFTWNQIFYLVPKNFYIWVFFEDKLNFRLTIQRQVKLDLFYLIKCQFFQVLLQDETIFLEIQWLYLF